MVGVISDYTFPKERQFDLDIRTVLDETADAKYSMNEDEIYWLNMWEDFLKNVNTETKLPGHPHPLAVSPIRYWNHPGGF